MTAREGSQEALEELQDLIKKGSKNGLQKGEFPDHVWSSFRTPNWHQNLLEMGPKRDPKRIHIHFTCILEFTQKSYHFTKHVVFAL